MHARTALPFLLLALASPLTHGAEALALQAAQVKALGIVTQAVGSGDESRPGTLPARVLVPNEQMRIVAAPVGGMIEMLAVAPGSRVKRGQLVARLASPQALELQRDALQAGSQSALLQQSLKRDEQLFAEGLIAESRLQATRAAAARGLVWVERVWRKADGFKRSVEISKELGLYRQNYCGCIFSKNIEL